MCSERLSYASVFLGDDWTLEAVTRCSSPPTLQARERELDIDAGEMHIFEASG